MSACEVVEGCPVPTHCAVADRCTYRRLHCGRYRTALRPETTPGPTICCDDGEHDECPGTTVRTGWGEQADYAGLCDCGCHDQQMELAL